MKADSKAVKRQLAIAKGQLEGLTKMVDQDAYCMDVSNQLLATIALLKRLNLLVLQAHLEGCVKGAAKSQDEKDLDAKIAEVETVLKRMGN